MPISQRMNGDRGAARLRSAWPSALGSEISTATAAGGEPHGAASVLVIRLLTATVILEIIYMPKNVKVSTFCLYF